MDALQQININMFGGIGFALFTVLVGTRTAQTGIRDYIFILTIATLGTASVLEQIAIDNSFITSCLIGFSIGFLADDVYLNLKATLPDFIKETLQDILKGVRDKIRKIFRS